MITGVVGYIGFKGINQMADSLTEIADVRLPSVLSLEIINEAQTAVKASERTLLIENLTAERRVNNEKEITEALERADAAWKVYAPLPQTKEEAGFWNEFVPAWNIWKKDVNDYLQMSKQYGQSHDKELIAKMQEFSLDQASKDFKAAEALLGKIIDINVTVSREEAVKSDVVEKRNKQAMIATVIVGLLIAISSALIIISIVQGQLGGDPSEVADIAKRVAVGDMSLTIDMHGKKSDSVMAAMQKMVEALGSITANAREVARGNLMVELKKRSNEDELMESLQSMVEKLKEVVLEVQSSADNVAAGSQELSASAQEMSQGATEQAASAEEVSSSMEQMTSNIRQNADNAQQTEKIAIKSARTPRRAARR